MVRVIVGKKPNYFIEVLFFSSVGHFFSSSSCLAGARRWQVHAEDYIPSASRAMESLLKKRFLLLLGLQKRESQIQLDCSADD